MSNDSFPSLSLLRRADSILDTVLYEVEGIVLVSGKAGSGVTTTITALAHDFLRNGKKVLHVRLGDSQVIPGIDAISSESLDKRLIGYFLALEDNAFDLVIFDEDEVNDKIIHLASVLAHRGMISVVGVQADSSEKAIELFGAAFSYDEQLKARTLKAIILAVNHVVLKITDESAVENQRSLPLHAIRTLFAEENPARKYEKPPTGHRVILNPYPYPMEF